MQVYSKSFFKKPLKERAVIGKVSRNNIAYKKRGSRTEAECVILELLGTAKLQIFHNHLTTFYCCRILVT